MSLDRTLGSQPPRPARKDALDPRIVLGIAVVLGGLTAHYVDWSTATLVFVSVVSLFTPRTE